MELFSHVKNVYIILQHSFIIITCPCLCPCLCLCSCQCPCLYPWLCPCLRPCIWPVFWACVCARICTLICDRVYACGWARICACVRDRVCAHVLICVCVHVHVTEKWTLHLAVYSPPPSPCPSPVTLLCYTCKSHNVNVELNNYSVCSVLRANAAGRLLQLMCNICTWIYQCDRIQYTPKTYVLEMC
jgi:hypothetical protein